MQTKETNRYTFIAIFKNDLDSIKDDRVISITVIKRIKFVWSC
jgi:hypothetical protein